MGTLMELNPSGDTRIQWDPNDKDVLMFSGIIGLLAWGVNDSRPFNSSRCRTSRTSRLSPRIHEEVAQASKELEATPC